MTETVEVIRKDHPCGSVVINREDLQPGDVVKGEEVEPEKTAPRRPRKSG